MSNRLTFLLLSFCTLFFACSKKSSTDTPFTPSYNASIFIGEDNGVLYAIDPVSGKKNWEFSCAASIIANSAKILASPLVYNGRVYFGTAGSICDTLYKLNAQTGELVKRIYVPLDCFHIVATPTADANLIYLATTNNSIFAIDTGTGIVKWSVNTSGAIQSSPIVYNGFIYFGCDDGNIYCIDKTLGPTGTHNWTWNPVSYGLTPYNLKWTSSPAIGYSTLPTGIKDTVLCIGGPDSFMYCLQLEGKTYSPNFLWQFKTHNAINSSPTMYGGACVFGCEDMWVYCVDLQDGYARWKTPTSSGISSSPFYRNGMIYVGSRDANLYAINFFNGRVKWQFSTMGMIKSSPVAYGPYIYIGSYDKNFYAVDTAYGTKKWSFEVNNNVECSPAVDNNTGGFGTNSSISGLVN